MAVQSVEDIRALLEELKGVLKDDLKTAAYKGEIFGPEGEYSIQDIRSALRELVDLLEVAVDGKASLFARAFSYEERGDIVRTLQNVVNHTTNPAHVANELDVRKGLVHRLRDVFGSEQGAQLQDMATDITAAHDVGQSSRAAMEAMQEEASQGLQAISSMKDEAIALATAAAEQASSAASSQSAVESSASVVTAAEQHSRDFVEQIEEREKQLGEQQTSSAEFLEKLELFKKSLEEAQEGLGGAQKSLDSFVEETREEVEKLMGEAREALSFRTGAGLAGAYHGRVTEAKGLGAWLEGVWWVLVAIVAAVGSVGLAVWATLKVGQGEVSFWDLVARLGIASIPLSLLWYALAQYSRRKNILEDYSYKAVLAQSIVGFLGQFEEEERSLYLEFLFKELFQDPMRKKHDEDTPLPNVLARLRSRTEGEGGE